MSLKSLMNFVMTDECYDKFFLELDFFDVDCFRAVLSKLLGFGIILGSVLVKVPQILKIVSAKSAQGLSFASLLLEMYAVTSMLSYSYAKSFPFSAWGDSFFMMFQNVVLGFLMQYYNGNTGIGAAYVVIYSAVLYALTSGLTSVSVLAALQASNLPAVAISKLMQALDNYKNGSTGQLSAITIFLVFAGSLTRIFTSIQETGDQLVILNYVVASACNGILTAQMLWYWNSNVKKNKKE